jgi:hypothetical protein
VRQRRRRTPAAKNKPIAAGWFSLKAQGAAAQFHPHDGPGQGAVKVIESINIYCPNFERSIRILQDAGLQGDSRPRRGYDEENHALLAYAARSHVPRRSDDLR